MQRPHTHLGQVRVYECVALTQLRPSLQACSALPDDNGLKGLGVYKDYFGISTLSSYVGSCGLPASTLKLNPPALTTCEGAAYKFSSLERYCAPVCM